MIRIKRSYPAPKSLYEEALVENGKYDKPDVIERLKNDFHNKCYICGLKNLQDPQVEHLLPHKNGKFHERKFDWDNLFWSCGHCNSVKNRNIYDNGIIDCCKIDPEVHLLFHVSQNTVSVTPINDNNDDTDLLTAQLIQEVFSITNTGMRVYKSEFRFHELLKEMNMLYSVLES